MKNIGEHLTEVSDRDIEHIFGSATSAELRELPGYPNISVVLLDTLIRRRKKAGVVVREVLNVNGLALPHSEAEKFAEETREGRGTVHGKLAVEVSFSVRGDSVGAAESWLTGRSTFPGQNNVPIQLEELLVDARVVPAANMNLMLPHAPGECAV